MTTVRVENVGIVVEDLDATVAFFLELGLELEGRMTVDQPWAARISGFDEVDVDIAMVRTPDGESRLELMSFRTPKAIGHQPEAPANTHGIRRILFSVPDVEDVLKRLRGHGAELVGELTRIDDSFLMCYVRGPEGIIVALAEKLG